MAEPLISRLQKAGAEVEATEVPAVLPIADVAQWAAQEERSFRLNYAVDPYDDDQLSRLRGTDPRSVLRRWAYVKHMWLRRQFEERKRAAERSRTARALLRREPMKVVLSNGRVVEVTGRSYAAMLEIARHWFRVRQMAVTLQHAAAAFAVVEAEAVAADETRPSLRRRLARIEELHAAVYLELQAHRQAMYAHCFTGSGAPAPSHADAPEWWAEIDEEDDSRLLDALYRVGPGRYAALGEPPERESKGGSPAEDFGYASLLSFYESKHGAEPGEYFSRDLQQILTHARAAAPALLDDVDL